MHHIYIYTSTTSFTPLTPFSNSTNPICREPKPDQTTCTLELGVNSSNYNFFGNQLLKIDEKCSFRTTGYEKKE